MLLAYKYSSLKGYPKLFDGCFVNGLVHGSEEFRTCYCKALMILYQMLAQESDHRRLEGGEAGGRDAMPTQ